MSKNKEIFMKTKGTKLVITKLLMANLINQIILDYQNQLTANTQPLLMKY